MPFRKKMKVVLNGFKYEAEDDDDGSPTSKSGNVYNKRTDIEYYKIGEIPASKYRGPFDQKHQNKLKAFSFEEATHDHRDMPDSYSPHGTRAPSRRSSWTSSNVADADSQTEPDEERAGSGDVPQGEERSGNPIDGESERGGDTAAVAAAAEAVRNVRLEGSDNNNNKNNNNNTPTEQTEKQSHRDVPNKKNNPSQIYPRKDRTRERNLLSEPKTEDTIKPSAT